MKALEMAIVGLRMEEINRGKKISKDEFHIIEKESKEII